MMKIAAGLCVALCLLAAANAETTPAVVGTAEAMLSGENQFPTPVITDTVAMFIGNATSKSIKWRLEVYDVINFTMAHIHLGNATDNGPPIVYLVPSGNAAKNSTLPMLNPPRSGSNLVFSGTFRATEVGPPLNGTTIPDLINIFAEGGAYVNIHTTAYPEGVARGQIEWQGDA